MFSHTGVLWFGARLVTGAWTCNAFGADLRALAWHRAGFPGVKNIFVSGALAIIQMRAMQFRPSQTVDKIIFDAVNPDHTNPDETRYTEIDNLICTCAITTTHGYIHNTHRTHTHIAPQLCQLDPGMAFGSSHGLARLSSLRWILEGLRCIGQVPDLAYCRMRESRQIQ